MSTGMDKKTSSLPRKLPLLLGVLIVLVATGVVAIAIPANTTDGTEKYSGVKLGAARNALAFDQGQYSPALFTSSTKAHVDNVEPSSQGQDSQGKPLRCTDDPNRIQYYS